MDNREAIKEWQARRAKRLEARNTNHTDTETEEGTWVTIKGTPVLIDGKGNIKNNFKDKGAKKRLGGENMGDIDSGVETKKTLTKREKDSRLYEDVKYKQRDVERVLDSFSAWVYDCQNDIENGDTSTDSINRGLSLLMKAIKGTDEYNEQYDPDDERYGEPDVLTYDAVQSLERLPKGTVLRIGDTAYKLGERKTPVGYMAVWESPDDWFSNSDIGRDILLEMSKGKKANVKVEKFGEGKAPKNTEIPYGQTYGNHGVVEEEPYYEEEHWYKNPNGTYSRMR